MKNVLFLFVFFSFPVITYCGITKSDSCKQFTTGNFTVEGETFIKIKRTSKYQYENNTRDKIKSKYKIVWLDNCTYRLTMIRTTHRIKHLIGVPIVHKIIRTDKNSYTYTTEYSYFSQDNCGTIREHVKKEETIMKVE